MTVRDANAPSTDRDVAGVVGKAENARSTNNRNNVPEKCALCQPPPLFLNGGREKILVTKFTDKSAINLDAREMTLDDLHDMVLATKARDKHSLPLLKLARFGNKRTERRCLRHNANLELLTGIEVDYDAEKIAFEDALDMIRRARLRALIYTSPSHTEAAPRWRIVLPTSQDLPAADRYKLVARVNGVLGGIIAGESFTLSQAYYFGKVGSNPDHCAVVIDGDFVDLRDDLDAGAMGKPGGISHSNGGGGGFETNGEWVADEVLVQSIIDGTSFHPSLVALSARYITRGAEPADVIAVLRGVMDQSTAPADDRWKAPTRAFPVSSSPRSNMRSGSARKKRGRRR